MMRMRVGVALAIALVAASGCSSTAKAPAPSSAILSGLVSAANAAPMCADLVGKPLPQLAKADGCIFVAADGSKNLRPVVSYNCSAGELFTFPGTSDETAYWAAAGHPVVSGSLNSAERAGQDC